MVAVVLSMLAFLLVLTMNRLTIAMSFVAVGLAFLYPFTKRVTHWPQLFLGLAFGWAVPMVSAAQVGTVTGTAWIIFIIAIVWALAYDTIYAMVDRPDDIKLGVKSTAILFGDYDVLIVILLQLVVLTSICILGLKFGLGFFFLGGMLLAALNVLRQWQLVKTRDSASCHRAFLLNNHMGGFIFLGIFLDYFLSHLHR